MLSEPDEIMQAFRGTALEGQAVTQEPDSNVLLVQWPHPDDLLPAWRAARSLTDTTGRWPLFLTNDFTKKLPPFVSPDTLARLDTAAGTVDPWSSRELQPWIDHTPIDAENLAETIRSVVRSRSVMSRLEPEVPRLAQDLAATVALPTTSDVVERWAFDRISTEPSLLDQLLDPSGAALPSRYGEWFAPEGVYLALLPTRSPWLPMAWHSYYGINDQETLAACLWQWHQTWGAELVASWGTMLQFVVARHPDFGPDAWTLAGQHLAVGNSLWISRLALAWDLSLRDTWFLHARP